MPTSPPSLEFAPAPSEPSQPVSAPATLVWIAALPLETASAMLSAIESAFAGNPVLLTSPDPPPGQLPPNIQWVAARGNAHRQGWVLSASDYLEAAQLAHEHQAARVVLLGANTHWIAAASLQELLGTSLDPKFDLVVPRPPAGAEGGLVTASLLYPLTRALFGIDVRQPLPTDAVLSLRFAQKLSLAAQRAATAANDALLWPVSEAAIAGNTVREVAIANYTLPHPPEETFQTLFPAVAGSLFADIEAKASFWQRSRGFGPPASAISRGVPASATEVSAEVRTLVENFRLAHRNLQELWSLVLPPQTLLALKRLSMASPEAFVLAPALWARIVYDFALAFRLRAINRGHLLGAFAPLYLGWVAAHARATEADPTAEPLLLADAALAFESERPYFVSRWRWPDRFNP